MGLSTLGFAARCEPVALPRRQQPDILGGYAPGAGLPSSDLLGQDHIKGIAQKVKRYIYGGAEPAAHPAAKPNPT